MCSASARYDKAYVHSIDTLLLFQKGRKVIKINEHIFLENLSMIVQIIVVCNWKSFLENLIMVAHSLA